ncbi:MAG: LysR family transcriptional regulator [Sandaracinaceae bacterium]|nr:LysR family transcriptional regulator [Sandaracinaceae bacterium]
MIADDALRWDDLRTFLAVARTGTLAGAAVALGVNASTVHRRVAGLEDALGAPLFERDPRGYRVTQLGEVLVPHAEEVEEAVLALRRKARGHDLDARGPVRLTLPETLLSVIAPALASVCEAAPGLLPIVRADDALLDLGRDADLALRPSARPPLDAVGRRLGTIAWAFYGRAEPPEAPRARRARRAPPPVEPLVAYAEGAAKAGQDRVAAPVLFEVSSVGAMHRVLPHVRAFGLLPCYLGDPDARLARRSEPIAEAATDLWLLVHADLRRSARVRALVDLLVPRLEAMMHVLDGRAAAS